MSRFRHFDEMTFSFIKFDEPLSSFDEMTFSLIKFDESLVKFDESLVKFDESLVKFDESLFSSLMRCLVKLDVSS
jgi:hypothetical protein